MRNKTAMFYVFISTLLVATASYAGVGDVAEGWLVSAALTSVFTIVGIVFGKKWLKLKKPLKELIDVYKAWDESKRDKSEGGKTITKKEYEQIMGEVSQFIEAVMAVVPESWIKKVRK